MSPTTAAPATAATVMRSCHLVIEHEAATRALIMTATRRFIPEDEFREILLQLESFVRRHAVQKLIFDQRRLRHFHHRSNEWLVCHWQPRMRAHGLLRYCYLLPRDTLYRTEFRFFLQQIGQEYPPHLFGDTQRFFCDTFTEALER